MLSQNPTDHTSNGSTAPARSRRARASRVGDRSRAGRERERSEHGHRARAQHRRLEPGQHDEPPDQRPRGAEPPPRSQPAQHDALRPPARTRRSARTPPSGATARRRGSRSTIAGDCRVSSPMTSPVNSARCSPSMAVACASPQQAADAVRRSSPPVFPARCRRRRSTSSSPTTWRTCARRGCAPPSGCRSPVTWTRSPAASRRRRRPDEP